jgi:NADPH:quinone reductase-like Zn-dependent oxidoreductase
MLSVAIISDDLRHARSVKSTSAVSLEATEFLVGLIDTVEPSFERNSDLNRLSVLVEVLAFSCNFRDKAIAVGCAEKAIGLNFFHFGSDFVARVIGVGADVSALSPGDLVIPNHCYPAHDDCEIPGVLTNHASKRMQVVPVAKLLKVPSSMNVATAAAFSVGAQTAYSLARKMEINHGEQVLLFGARSNTSLFLTAALANNQGVRTGAIRARNGSQTSLAKAYDDLVLSQDLIPATGEMSPLRFNVIFDPFFDLNLATAISLLKDGGRYITCGFYDQLAGLSASYPASQNNISLDVLKSVVLRNLRIIGNCLGTCDDLRRALEDHVEGLFPVKIDSVFHGDEVGQFIKRSFYSKIRVGKVIYIYD